MSYQSVNPNTTERFFTVVRRTDGKAITSGTVNYYLRSRSGDNEGKWWHDAIQSWVIGEIGNPMTHNADGHWEIDLSMSPFTAANMRLLEYVKETNDNHIPDSRHLIVEETVPDNASIEQILTVVQQNPQEIIDAVVGAIQSLTIEVQPTRTILGPCDESVKTGYLLPK